MKTLASRSINLLLVLVTSATFLLPLQARTRFAFQAQATAKIDQLLKDAGYDAQRKRDDIWVINRKGKNIGDFGVIVSAQAGYVLVGVLVARKAELRMTSELSLKLLRLADLIDFVKVGLDSDEDLFVRTEIRTRLVDQQSLKEVIEDVCTAADKAYAEVKPFLKTP